VRDLRLFFVTFHLAASAYDQPMHEGYYCTYIMASRSHTLYVGVTGNFLKCVFQHKWKDHEGFTAEPPPGTSLAAVANDPPRDITKTASKGNAGKLTSGVGRIAFR